LRLFFPGQEIVRILVLFGEKVVRAGALFFRRGKCGLLCGLFLGQKIVDAFLRLCQQKAVTLGRIHTIQVTLQ